MSKRILLLGATGLVGGHALAALEAEPAYTAIRILSRRPLPDLADRPGVTVHVVDFDDPDSYAQALDVDQVLCALGTTIKKAGSKEAFRTVDVIYPYEVAERAHARGATHMLLVSALGADPDSRFFYNRCKGELEQLLRDLQFRSLTIARPSLLRGDRDEFRLGERIADAFSFLYPSKYKPIHARTVAHALVASGVADRPGERVLESAEMREAYAAS